VVHVLRTQVYDENSSTHSDDPQTPLHSLFFCPVMLDDKPSKTALIVAIILIVLGGDEYGSSRCPPGSVKAQIEVLQRCGVFRIPFAWIHNPIFAKLARWCLHSCVYAQFLEGVGVRKLYMEHAVRTFLATQNMTTATAIAPQVLVIAAGYDTLAFRLSRDYYYSPEKVVFWEIDHPATSMRKQMAASTATASAASNVRYVMADLAKTTLREVLLNSETKYNPTAPTIVIVEGLTMYLTGEQVLDLFQDVATVVGPNSKICFDHFGWRNGGLDNGWITHLQKMFANGVGEPWFWGIDPSNLQEFLKDNPFKVVDQSAKTGLEFMVTLELK
jgi:methyltransferase (TIGR00027 family)